MIGRALPVATRADLLRGSSRNALIGFLRISSPIITNGIALVTDVVEHTLGGVTYLPAGLGLATPRESNGASPRESINLPNVDRRIGAALRKSNAAMMVSIDWYTMADFDLSVTPRVPMTGARPIVSMEDWSVVEVSGASASSVSLVIQIRDIDQESYNLRATPSIAPGLYP